MPHSSDQGKAAVVALVRELRPMRILDIGAGSGTYARLLRREAPAHAFFTAVEVWQPYLQEYELDALYDQVLWADVRALDANSYRPYDLVIFGDVLEHLDAHDAVWAWEEARQVTTVVASVPNRHWPQGPEYGNPYEEHRWHMTTEQFLENFPGITEHTVDGDISVYVGRPDEIDRPTPEHATPESETAHEQMAETR